MSDKTYQDGLVEGRLISLENIAAAHKDRLDGQSKRLRILERLVWATGGVIVFVEMWPVFGRTMLAMLPTAAGAQ